MTSILAFGFLFNGIRILTGAFIVFYMFEKGLTLIDIGIIKSFQAFIMMVTDIPLGYFADRKSYKLSIILAAAFATTWLFLMGVSTSFSGLLLAEFFNALSLTLIAGAYNALLVQYAKTKLTSTKKVLGSSSQYNYIGMFIFSLIGAYFADYSRQYIWYISAFLMMMTTIFGLFFLDDLKGEQKLRKANSLISDAREMLSLFVKVPYISLCFYFSLIFFNIFSQYWQWIFKDYDIHVTYFYLGVIFSLILFSQLLASFLFTKLSERMNFVLLLFLSVSMIFTVAFFDPGKEIAVLLVCMIFYLIKYTSLRVEVVLHDSISDNLRATYESFLSTVGRLSLLLFFYFSAYMVNIFGFLSLVYILGIYLSIYLFAVCFLEGTLKKSQ
ncbi:MFS transporter [Bartonella vinsonii]|uniref:Major Facilitator Superfamily n=1 Tax=Bartonella vinsonii TaxID=33047 RepID=A0A3S5C6L6_BARVI|nr:MFS transporter [Bartonella vinsonii]VEJ45574.1 Major Facilitator Superfamily [Bartonella vinsonii]